MKSPFMMMAAVGLLATFSTSCKEDPELVRKRDEQKVEITRLEGEVAILEVKLKDPVPDRSKELAEAKTQVEAQTAEIARIEKEISTLETRKTAVEKDFADYRSKYFLKNN
ncbi:MAG: hypothetical protein QM755_06950 [Luteolibacter sp.]